MVTPKYLIVCLDSPGPTFRDKEYIAYRAQRKPSDPELISQLPLVKETLETATIPSFALGGYEADDIIATVARNSLKRVSTKKRQRLVSKVTIITGDKDLMQLVNAKTQLFMPIRGLSQTKTFFTKDVPPRAKTQASGRHSAQDRPSMTASQRIIEPVFSISAPV